MTKQKNKKAIVCRRKRHLESLTFNQVVRGSNPRTLIVEQAILLVLFVILTYILITLVVYFDYTYAMQKIQHRHNM